MLAPATQSVTTLPAFVARIPGVGAEGPAYLRLSPDGGQEWVDDRSAATPFATMREATRQATRLPAKLRAFGLPFRD